MAIPFLGRLNPFEYVAIVGSFVLIGLEAIIRVLTLALPSTLLSLFYLASRSAFNRFASPAERRASKRQKSVSNSIRDASDFVELCSLFGYEAEEHIIQTKDGYLLGLHRLAYRKGEEGTKVNCGPSSVQKRVVYMHHGLLMNSEVWVCLTEAERCLPFALVDQGFDVWLGNNRGNKYSKKSCNHSPTSPEFWNFSIDEFAFHDIPDSIAYVLETTGQESLSYIGFSQGTAQAFATLAIHPKLNQQVNVFIALAPAMSPAGLSNGIVDALIKASPSVLFLLFGRRSILSSATMWQSIMYPPIFVKIIDVGMSFLFGWKTKNISMSQKFAAYPHLYSFTSTKSVVHWFQIIRNQSFQMYDDDLQAPLTFGLSNRSTKVARYPTRNIKTPIVLVYGGSDSLVDIKVMLRELPPQTIATEVPHYEHLDFLWARDVNELVFKHVFDALESFTDAEHTKEEYARYNMFRQESLQESALRRSKSQSLSQVQPLLQLQPQPQESEASRPHQPYDLSDGAATLNGDAQKPMPSPPLSRTPSLNHEREENPPMPETPRPRAHAHNSSLSIDEDFFSWTPETVVEPLASPVRSLRSVNLRRGGKGITLGASKAAGGIVTTSGAEAASLSPGGEAKSPWRK